MVVQDGSEWKAMVRSCCANECVNEECQKWSDVEEGSDLTKNGEVKELGMETVDVIPQKHMTRFSAMTESPTQTLTFPKVWPHIFILLM